MISSNISTIIYVPAFGFLKVEQQALWNCICAQMSQKTKQRSARTISFLSAFSKASRRGERSEGSSKVRGHFRFLPSRLFLSRWWRVVVVGYNNHSHFDSNLSLVGNEKAVWTVTSVIRRQKSSKLLFQSSTYRAMMSLISVTDHTQLWFFDFWTKPIFKQIWNKPLKHRVIVRSSLVILPPYWTLKLRREY